MFVRAFKSTITRVVKPQENIGIVKSPFQFTKNLTTTSKLLSDGSSGHNHSNIEPPPICSDGVPPPVNKENLDNHSDREILDMINAGLLQSHQLEDKLTDISRAVKIRRHFFAKEKDWSEIPYKNYKWDMVKGKNCENVIGYVPIPLGIIGPLLINGKEYFIPMGTTEGCLVASTHRGAKAITVSGGASAVVVATGMTRAPVVKMPNAKRAAELKAWLEDDANFKQVAKVFNSTSSYGKLQSIKVNLAGKNAYLRFQCTSGDAMGMNIVSKGCERALEFLRDKFPDLTVITIAGNFCTDKKAAAVNWIMGRGRSVVCDATIKASVVKSVLKTTVDAMVDVNINKSLVGSAIAGAIGGFNAHAANIVTAIFLATGQDPAQNVESSNCITILEKNDEGDLYVSITMPSLEVGTIGGGTSLPAQMACLDMMGCKGTGRVPGENADTLAQVIAGTVMAGELSLLGAQAAGTLVQSHMRLNRKNN